jgi:hypothetical protein
MRKPLLALAALVVAVPVLSVPVSAAPGLPKVVERSDPEDVDGRLDIVRIRVRVSTARVRLTAETAERWRCRYVKDDASTAEGAAAAYEDGKGVFFFWGIDNDKDSAYEIEAHVRCKDGELRLVTDQLFRSVAARKSNGRTVTASVSRKKWELGGRRLQLRAVSQVNGTDGTEIYTEQRDETRRLRPFGRRS